MKKTKGGDGKKSQKQVQHSGQTTGRKVSWLRTGGRNKKQSMLLLETNSCDSYKIDVKRLTQDSEYVFCSLLNLQSKILYSDIPTTALTTVIMSMLEFVRTKCPYLHLKRKTFTESVGIHKTKCRLYKFNCERNDPVYLIFSPKEFNPVGPDAVKPGLEPYENMSVVIMGTGFYLWLPVNKRLITLDYHRLFYILKLDRKIGLHFMIQIKAFFDVLVQNVERQLWQLKPTVEQFNSVFYRIYMG